MSFYNHEKNYIFLHNPRTAGTSMEQQLGGGSHTTLPQFRKFFIEETNLGWSDIFKFMFVRHPIERFLSAMAIKGGVTVDEALYAVEQELWETPRYAVFIPQHEMARANDLDFIGRFENLEDDWKVIQDKFDLAPLEHLRKSKRPKPVLSAKQYDWARKVYTGDFRQFNYK